MMASQITDKRCVCKVCDKKFKSASILSQHMLIHTGVKPFKCNLCDKGFSRSDSLKQHIAKHTGEKNVHMQRM